MVKIITGYTGERHITPAMDAAVYRSIFGPDSYILRESGNVAASMPDINSFVVADGMVSIQGRQVQIKQETLSIDTCPSAKKRIDLVAVRYAHDSGSQIDSAALVVIKGTEVASANDPSVPTYNSGDLDDGATVVDFPMYRIDLSGSTVTFACIAPIIDGDMINILASDDPGADRGRDLSLLFDSFADLMTAVRAGDFTNIKNGDYWPIVLTGTFKDYAANSNKTLTKAVLKMEANINPYTRYGDSGDITDGRGHILWISRDLLPVTLQYRSANTTWYRSSETNPWRGSHLYETLNNESNGLIALIAATVMGPYIYAGPNSKGMRSLMEVKGPSSNNTTSWGWGDRGKLFVPTEQEVWGQTIFADSQYHSKGCPLQLPVFVGSRKHIVKGLGDGGSRNSWWCESADSGNTSYIALVNNYGYPNRYGAANSDGVPVCFITL